LEEADTEYRKLLAIHDKIWTDSLETRRAVFHKENEIKDLKDLVKGLHLTISGMTDADERNARLAKLEAENLKLREGIEKLGELL
jgi:hypothetical protein